MKTLSIYSKDKFSKCVVRWYRINLKTNFWWKWCYSEKIYLKFCSLMTRLRRKDFKKGLSLFLYSNNLFKSFSDALLWEKYFLFLLYQWQTITHFSNTFFDNLTRIIIFEIYCENQNTFRTELEHNKRPAQEKYHDWGKVKRPKNYPPN
jgi:hypothetical protein